MRVEFNYKLIEAPRETLRKYQLKVREEGDDIKGILDTVFSDERT